MNIGITFGKYQPCHNGHILFLRNMLNYCDMLFIVVFGETVKKAMPKQYVIDTIQEYLGENVIVIGNNEINVVGAYVPQIIYNIYNSYLKNKLKSDDTITAYCGDDRLIGFTEQIYKRPIKLNQIDEYITLDDLITILGISNISLGVPQGKNEITLNNSDINFVNTLNIKINKGSEGRISGSLIRGLASVNADTYSKYKKHILLLFSKCVPTSNVEKTYNIYREYYA
jgi:cytidyltransferase-like protein